MYIYICICIYICMYVVVICIFTLCILIYVYACVYVHINFCKWKNRAAANASCLWHCTCSLCGIPDSNFDSQARLEGVWHRGVYWYTMYVHTCTYTYTHLYPWCTYIRTQNVFTYMQVCLRMYVLTKSSKVGTALFVFDCVSCIWFIFHLIGLVLAARAGSVDICRYLL